MSSSSPKLRNDIQGLRAVAVVAVILFHFNKSWLPGGFVGVDIFFVISGYLITQILLRQTLSAEALRRFYVKRIRRIVPAYAVLLLLVTAAAAVLLTPQDFKHYWDSLLSALTFRSNQYYAGFGEYFAPRSTEWPLLHLWSIAIEMQFYLLLPFVLLVLPRRWVGIVLGVFALALLTYSAHRLGDSQRSTAVYFSLLGRIPEFLVGSVLAATRLSEGWSATLRQAAAWVGALAVATSLFLLNESTPFPGYAAMLPCLGAALIIAGNGSALSRALSVAPLVWLGGLSYSLYLWHWPVFSLFRYYTETYEMAWVPGLSALILTGMLAYLSFRFIEVPFRSEGARGRGPWATATLVVGAVALALCGRVLNAKMVSAPPLEMTRYAAPEAICHGQMVGDCLRGDRASAEEWLLVGDSHGAQLNLFFDVVGQADHFKTRIITGSSCVTIPGFDVERVPEWSRAACLQQILNAQPYLDTAEVVVVAGMWQYHAPSEPFLKAFERFLESMQRRKKRVIVFAQVPMFDGAALRTQRFAQFGMNKTQSIHKEWAAANERVRALVAKFPSASFVDLSQHEVFAKAPFYRGSLMYYDEHHLNERGAKAYGEAAKGLLKRRKP